jgi:TRAP-type C4-dicarboxylate transport system substrate-binding protein
MWLAIGCSGVPLGVPEVYGALQTGMVDSIISTGLAAVALQWHTNLTHVTERTHCPLVAGLVVSMAKWDSIPEDIRAKIYDQIRKTYEGDSKDVRKDDEKAYKNLLKRGYTAMPYSAEGEKELEMYSKKARESLVGRVYSKELLERVLSFKK